MKEEYRNRERFVRHAGSAIVALLGVNDQTDLGDVKRIASLLQYAREMQYFENCNKNNLIKREQVKNNPSLLSEMNEEINHCSSNYAFWENKFLLEYNKVEAFVNGAVWDLEQLIKHSTTALTALKSGIELVEASKLFDK